VGAEVVAVDAVVAAVNSKGGMTWVLYSRLSEIVEL